MGGPLTCEYCALAEANPKSGLYESGCNECMTRMTAHGLPFHAWRARGSNPAHMPKEYAKALGRIKRKGEELRDTHGRVKAWATRIKSAL